MASVPNAAGEQKYTFILVDSLKETGNIFEISSLSIASTH